MPLNASLPVSFHRKPARELRPRNPAKDDLWRRHNAPTVVALLCIEFFSVVDVKAMKCNARTGAWRSADRVLNLEGLVALGQVLGLREGVCLAFHSANLRKPHGNA